MSYRLRSLQGSTRSLGVAAGICLVTTVFVMSAAVASAEDDVAGMAVKAASDAPASAVAAINVSALWGKHCKSCHGSDGKGKTKAGRAKKVKDLTDPKVRAEFDRCEMIKNVTKGVFDDKDKARMKPFEKKLSEAEIEALIDHVIGLSE